MKRLIYSALVSLVVAAFSAAPASATSIIKLGLGPTGPDVALIGGVFGTVDEGNAGTLGHQDTNVEYVGFLESLAHILAGASFTLTGVTVDGPATVLGGIVVQSTTGGTFQLYDDSNSLLLAGTLSAGAITGSTSGTAGSFFNTSIATFTAGSLLTYVLNQPAGLSFALTNIASDAGEGLSLFNCNQNETQCELGNFSADATGLIEGRQVPEPFSAGLLTAGLLAGAAFRRKRSA